MSTTIAIVTLVGFAIQRALELLDPLISWLARWPQKDDAETSGDKTDTDGGGHEKSKERKKWVMGICALLLSLGATLTIGISLLQHLDPELKGKAVDVIVTALVVGASTEGLNSITKYFGYLKDKTSAD